MTDASDSQAAAAAPDGYLRKLFGLEGQTALVTGATSGLGAACARALAGAEVVVSGRDRARGARLAEEIRAAGGRASLELADVGDPVQIQQLADRVLQRHGQLDILVTAAGVFIRGEAVEAPRDDWETTLRTNVTGTFLTCQAFAPHMIARGRGKVILFSSTDGLVGVVEQAAYCASKGAIVQLTRTLGAEWIRHGVNVNAIAPCDFATPMVEAVLGDPEYRDWITQAIPAGRVGQPDELAGAVVYLASRASDMVVGHTLLVDGGRTAI